LHGGLETNKIGLGICGGGDVGVFIVVN